MNDIELFSSLEKKKKTDLINLLKASYLEMQSSQRQAVFGGMMTETIKSSMLNKASANSIQHDAESFYKESLRGDYYEPFEINSKNFMDLPEKTEEWGNKFGELLDKSSQLSQQGFHEVAIKCFKHLFDLLGRLGSDEIIFADTVGSWMAGGDEKEAISCYLTSLAMFATTDEFVEHAIPLVKKDSYESFSNRTYLKATSIGKREQISLLNAEIKRLKIQVEKK